jgi:hypothetical protein
MNTHRYGAENSNADVKADVIGYAKKGGDAVKTLAGKK